MSSRSPTPASTRSRQPASSAGTIVLKGGRIDALGADVAVPPGAQVIDAAGADVYPGFIDPQHDARPRRAGSARLCRHGRVGRVQPAPADAHRVPPRQRRHPGRARPTASRPSASRPSGGILAGEVAVMQLDGWTWEEATLRPSAGIAFQFPPISPAAGLRGAAAERDKTYADLKKERDRTLDTLADLLGAGARVRANAAGRAPPTGCWRRWRPSSKASCRWSSTANREADIRDAVAFGERERVRHRD